jgi:hypothetical protein
MTCAELKALVAERRESYTETLAATVTRLATTYGWVGIEQSGLVPIPIFRTPPTPEERHQLADVLSDYSRLVNNILGLCSFIAPSGRAISISQSAMSEDVVLTIRMDGELSEIDRAATERFIQEELHLELGKSVSGSTFVESGTERLLSTSVTYCENDLYGRRRKGAKRGAGKKARAASA